MNYHEEAFSLWMKAAEAKTPEKRVELIAAALQDGYRAGVEAMLQGAIDDLETMYPAMLPSVIERYRRTAARLLEKAE